MHHGTIHGPLPDPGGPTAPVHHRIDCPDPERTREVCRRFYSDAEVQVRPAADAGFVVRGDILQLGPVTVGAVTMGPTVTVGVPRVEGYNVSVVHRGRMVSNQRDVEVISSPGHTAGILHPGGAAAASHLPGSRSLQIKLAEATLREELAALLDRPIRGAVHLGPRLDLRSGPGRSWAMLVGLLRDECRHRDGLIYQPLVADRLWRAVVTGLLLAAPHRWHDELAAPVTAGPPRAVRQVVDAVHAEPQRPYTVHELARIGGVSVRSLQEAFRRHLGTTPMLYLQHVRLTESHVALRHADPHRVTVASVAHRWGFAHLGRFARAYHARYGVHPSTTLRQGR